MRPELGTSGRPRPGEAVRHAGNPSLTKSLLCVLFRFMAATTQLPAPSIPSRLGRVLSLVRKLIDYGKQLAGTVQHRAATPGFALLRQTLRHRRPRRHPRPHHQWPASRHRTGSQRFANAPPAARTSRRRPSALPATRGPRPARQSRRRTLSPNPGPPTTPRTRASLASPRRRKSPPRCVAARSAPSSSISAVTSASRPASSTGHSGTNSATPSSRYGGSLAGFLGNLNRRLFAFGSGDHSDRADPGWPAAPPRLPAPATGPP